VRTGSGGGHGSRYMLSYATMQVCLRAASTSTPARQTAPATVFGSAVVDRRPAVVVVHGLG
jgi:hypothetical protein